MRSDEVDVILSLPYNARVCVLVPRRPRVRFMLDFGNGFKAEGEEMLVTLTVDQKVTAAFAVTDKFGNPAKLDGVPEWSASDDKLALEVSADGLTCVVKAGTGVAGTAQVTVTGDADLGEGVKPILGVLDVELVAGEAVNIVVTAGTPEPL